MNQQPSLGETRKHVETSPESKRIVERISRYIAGAKKGAALFADYGHHGEGEDTFRGYQKSEQVEPLSVEPGSADLTADVDFSQIVSCVNAVRGVQTVGPVTQREYLVNMGFLHRLEVLLKNCRDRGDIEGRKALMTQTETLLANDKMGQRFKFLAIVPENSAAIAGFAPLS